jgi:hypothetical protein
MNPVGYGVQATEQRDYIIHPHELSTLNDVILLTPQGRFRINKTYMVSDLDTTHEAVSEQAKLCPDNLTENGGSIKMLTVKERTENADRKVQQSLHQQRVDKKNEKERRKKEADRRKYVIGGLIIKYFPELNNIELGATNDESDVRFEPLAVILRELAADRELVEQLRQGVRKRTAQSAESAAHGRDA